MDADEREAPRFALLLRVKNTVPKKIATVTPKTPRFPQSTPLHPETKNRPTTIDPDRSAAIEPPEMRRGGRPSM